MNIMDTPSRTSSPGRPFVIAEGGVNHNGDLRLAIELIDAAANAGCDAIKFQTWVTEDVYSRTLSIKPDYQLAGTNPEESEYDTIKRLELSFDSFRTLKAHADRSGLIFLSTPDEEKSARFLVELGVPMLKTASQDVTNLPFLRHIARYGLPVIYSTGACTVSELAAGAEAILEINPRLTILHCVSSYPAPMAELNLAFIPTLQRMFGVPVGFSDHTTGQDAACVATGLGATVFEKHLTLSRGMEGPDHAASLEPQEMAAYVRAVKSAHDALGDGLKRIMPCERNARLAFQRYIVLRDARPAGHVVTAEDLVFKKTGSGLPPDRMSQVVGARLKAAVEADTPLSLHMLSWT